MDNDRNKRVESYLLGKMSATERRQFEQDITTNVNLADALRVQEMEHEVMEAMVELDLFSEMNVWRAEAEATEAKVIPLEGRAKVVPFYRRLSTLAIAASLLLLMGAAFWLFQPTDNPVGTPPLAQEEIPTPSPTTTVEETPTDNSIAQNEEETTPPPKEEPTIDEPKATPEPKISTPSTPTPSTPNYLALAEDYATPLQLGTVRSIETDKPVLTTALENLSKGDLTEGIQQLTALATAEPTNLDVQYYLGLAQYQQKNYAAAIAPLQKVSADAFYLETEKAQWYLILAYLQTGQKEKAKADLQEIVNDPEHSYYRDAMKIDKSL